MGKNPADQFYWGDWLNDVELQAASALTRGVWINALCKMWFSKTRGEIFGNKTSLARTCNCLEVEFDTFLSEAQTFGFCEVSQNSHNVLTLQNRRMYRAEKKKESDRLRAKKSYHKKQPRGGSKKTSHPLSSSSTSNKYSPTSDEFRLANLLFNLIKKRNQNHKTPNLQVWAKHCDRMLRIDNRNVRTVEAVIRWCQKDEFWQNNILSTEKLKKQFDQLVLKMGKAAPADTATPEKPMCDKCKTRESVGRYDNGLDRPDLCRECWPQAKKKAHEVGGLTGPLRAKVQHTENENG